MVKHTSFLIVWKYTNIIVSIIGMLMTQKPIIINVGANQAWNSNFSWVRIFEINQVQCSNLWFIRLKKTLPLRQKISADFFFLWVYSNTKNNILFMFTECAWEKNANWSFLQNWDTELLEHHQKFREILFWFSKLNWRKLIEKMSSDIHPDPVVAWRRASISYTSLLLFS